MLTKLQIGGILLVIGSIGCGSFNAVYRIYEFAQWIYIPAWRLYASVIGLVSSWASIYLLISTSGWQDGLLTLVVWSPGFFSG